MRIFREGLGGHSAKKEFEIQEILYNQGVKVPRPFFYENSTSILGHPYFVMEFVEGSPMHLLVEKEAHKFGHYAELFLNELFKIHQITLTELHQYSSPMDYVGEFKERILKYKIDELLPLLEWFDNQDVIQGTNTLIHGDYHAANVIVTENDEIYVIDWANQSVGDYRIDLSFAIVVSEAFLGTQVQDNFVNMYSNISGQQVESIEYFMILSSLFNVLRMYSAILNPNITGENDSTIEIIKKEFKPYMNYMYNLILSTTGVSLQSLTTEIYI